MLPKIASFVLTLNFVLISSLKLPDYIQPCSLSDANLNECIKNNGNKAISSLVEGDRKYRIINLRPFKSPKIVLDSGKNLKITLLDVTVWNLDHLVVNEVVFNKEKNHLYFKGDIDVLRMEGLYNMTGRILVLPLTGNGNVNASLNGGTYEYNLFMKEFTKNNEIYYKIDSSSIDYNLKRGYFHFENLFNGDKALGDQMNKFIDENWQVIADEIKPALAETFRSVVDSIFAGYFKTVPLKDLFLE